MRSNALRFGEEQADRELFEQIYFAPICPTESFWNEQFFGNNPANLTELADCAK
jgi:hypothetical protein